MDLHQIMHSSRSREYRDRLKDVDSVGVENGGFPVAVNTGLHNCATCELHSIRIPHRKINIVAERLMQWNANSRWKVMNAQHTIGLILDFLTCNVCMVSLQDVDQFEQQFAPNLKKPPTIIFFI